MRNAEDADLATVKRYIQVDGLLKDSSNRLSARRRHKLTLEWHRVALALLDVTFPVHVCFISLIKGSSGGKDRVGEVPPTGHTPVHC